KKLLVLLAAVLVAVGGVVLYKNRHHLFRPDIARTGGTYLTFEVAEWYGSNHDVAALAQAVQRRVDPSGADGITVQPEGDDRVIVGVRRGSRHDDLVDRVKRLLGRSGRLEVRMVANRTDDLEALTAAEKALLDPKTHPELAKREKKDTPPPAPLNRDGKPTF